MSKCLHAVEKVVALGLLVDDRVDADGGLARLTVTDDQLTLSAPDGDQSVHGLEAGLRRTKKNTNCHTHTRRGESDGISSTHSTLGSASNILTFIDK